MPAGNHHYTPSGIWFQNPTSSTLPRLVLRSVGTLLFGTLLIVGFNLHRSMQWNYTYTSFIGKTITMGKTSTLTHEPASVEVIDKLKAEEAERKK